MASKSRKSRKQKKTPVRLITPKTVDIPADVPAPQAKETAVTAGGQKRPETLSELKKSSLIPELKRIGLIFSVVAVLMVVLAIIF
jgi:hypothetical protein